MRTVNDDKLTLYRHERLPLWFVRNPFYWGGVQHAQFDSFEDARRVLCGNIT
jgi:hypothetical protein